MNLTLRVVIHGGGDGDVPRSLVVKQSRGHIEKHPSIAAPAERIVFEHGFYAEVNALPESADREAIRSFLPAVRGFNAGQRLLVLEDLGVAADLFTVYDGGGFAPGELAALGHWPGRLHAATRGRAPSNLRDNGAMRELNAEHLFEVPLDGVARFGMNLDDLAPGLTAAADALRRDAGVRAAFGRAQAMYLATSNRASVLLHGDFHPGSWLRTPAGVKVIDPEFCFHGAPEVDAGVALGHLAIAGVEASEAESFFTAYGHALCEAKLRDMAGVEVIRRLIGVGQLPLGKAAHRVDALGRARAVLSGSADWRGLFPAARAD